MSNIIVSVHLPKTAGTTFLYYLNQLSHALFLMDKADMPLASHYEKRKMQNLPEDMKRYLQMATVAAENRESFVIVHGHFLATKYDHIFPENRSLVWLRDPAQRLVSHYEFWKRNPQPDNDICREMIQKDMDLKTFAQFEPMRNIYSRFLGSRSIKSFSFVGIVEQFNQSVELFKKIIAPNMTFTLPERQLENPHKGQNNYGIGDRVLEIIKEYHAEDYTIYNAGCSYFEEQCRKFI